MENLPHGLGEEGHVFPPAGEAHQPDPPDLSLQGSESAGDVDVIGLAQARPDGRVIDAVGDADRIQGRQTVLTRDKEFQPEGFHLVPEILRNSLVAEPAVLQPFLEDEPQSFAETIMEGRGGGVVINPLLIPIFFDHRQIEAPIGNAGFPPVEGLPGLIAHGKGGKAGRATEAFLRCAVRYVDTPGVDVQRNAAQGGDAVDQKESAVPVNDVGHPLQGLERSGGRLPMDEGQDLDRFVFDKGGFDLRRGEYTAPGFFNSFHIGAVDLRHLAHPFAEIAVAADDDRIAGLHEIAEGGFHPGAAGTRHGKGHSVLRLKNRPEKDLLFVHQGEPLRIEVSDQFRTHRAQDTRMNGAGPGAEKETMRYIQIVDRECHVYPPLIRWENRRKSCQKRTTAFCLHPPEKKRLSDTMRGGKCQAKIITIIHHLILRRLDFPFFNAFCLGWLQYFPSKEILSNFYMNALLQQFPMGKVGKLHPFRENML